MSRLNYVWEYHYIDNASLKCLMLMYPSHVVDLTLGLTCLQCNDVAQPRMCTRVTECQPGEVITFVVLYMHLLCMWNSKINYIYVYSLAWSKKEWFWYFWCGNLRHNFNKSNLCFGTGLQGIETYQRIWGDRIRFTLRKQTGMRFV